MKKKDLVVFDGYFDYSENIYNLIGINKSDMSKVIIPIKNPVLHLKTTKPTTKLVYFLKEYEWKKLNVNDWVIPYRDYAQIRKYLSKLYTEITKNELNVSKIESFARGNIKSPKFFKKYKPILCYEEELYNDADLFTDIVYYKKFNFTDIVEYQNYTIFDIEVINNIDGKFPSPEYAEHPITAISIFRKIGDKEQYYLLYYKMEELQRKIDTEQENMYLANLLRRIKKLKYMEDMPVKIKGFNDEKEMLKIFLKVIGNSLTFHAWNGDNFDIPYILNRAYKLGLSDYVEDVLGSIYEKDYKIVRKWLPKLKNFFHRFDKTKYIDYINLILFNLGENWLERRGLNWVANKVLDKKIYNLDISEEIDEESDTNEDVGKFDIKNIVDAYFNRFEDFLYYAFKDTYLVTEIDRNLQLISFTYTLKSSVPFHINNFNIGSVIDAYLSYFSFKNNVMFINTEKKSFYADKIFKIYMRLNKDFGFTFPYSRPDYETDFILVDGKEWDDKTYDKKRYTFIKNKYKYVAGFVQEPIPDLYLNVIDYDARSLYPTLIYNFNISHDSLRAVIPENLALMFVYEKDYIKEHLERFKNTDIEIYSVKHDKFVKLNIIELYKMIIKHRYIISDNGCLFENPYTEDGKKIPEKVGVLNSATELPIKQRTIYKNEMKKYKKGSPMYVRFDGNQKTEKTKANSLYGSNADKYSRYYNQFIASAIPSNGRSNILYTSYMINKYFNELVNSS